MTSVAAISTEMAAWASMWRSWSAREVSSAVGRRRSLRPPGSQRSGSIGARRRPPDGIRREAADPTDQAPARTVVDWTAAEAGPPEVLVNTNGTYHLGEALTATPGNLRLMVGVNVDAALWLTPAVAPYLQERGLVSIVHVAARPGLESAAGMPPTPSARPP